MRCSGVRRSKGVLYIVHIKGLPLAIPQSPDLDLEAAGDLGEE